MNLALVISSLSSGGAERVLTSMANYWAGVGHEVTLLTLASPSQQPFYPLDPGVKLKQLGLVTQSSNPLAAAAANIRRVFHLRKAIKNTRPDTVISFMDTTNVLTLLACRPLDVPVIASERIDPAQYCPGRIWAMLRCWTYSQAATIVIQTKGVKDRLPPRQQKLAQVIPNPVQIPDAVQPPIVETSRPLLLAVGRLTKQKGFDILLKAFALIADKHPDWTLAVFGDGQERAALTTQRNNLGLNTRVLLPGTTPDMFAQYRAADAFVLCSRFEGFPNVLLEAMACGLPCVAFDCPSGPGEIVEHGKNGLLAEPNNVDALAKNIDTLMSNNKQRSMLGQEAKKVLDHYALPSVMARWNSLLGR